MPSGFGSSPMAKPTPTLFAMLGCKPERLDLYVWAKEIDAERSLNCTGLFPSVPVLPRNIILQKGVICQKAFLEAFILASLARCCSSLHRHIYIYTWTHEHGNENRPALVRLVCCEPEFSA